MLSSAQNTTEKDVVDTTMTPSEDMNTSVMTTRNSRSKTNSSLTLAHLPDEIISMCYAQLPVKDLVALEMVSRRMHTLVRSDNVCWSRCSLERWGDRISTAFLNAAATHAGGWKSLYAQKHPCEMAHIPWDVPCAAETEAMLELIKGFPRTITSMKVAPETGSPRAISALEMAVPRSLSVVLLIDGSSSVTEEDFKAMKEFASSLAASLAATHDDAALALVQFNQHPKVEAPLTPVARGSLRHAIAALDQMMGSTDISAPIRRAREMLSEEARETEKVIILMTDGQTHVDELQESEKEARTANREVGARVFTLGVGRDVDVAGLSRVATGKAEIAADATAEKLAQGCYFALRCLRV